MTQLWLSTRQLSLGEKKSNGPPQFGCGRTGPPVSRRRTSLSPKSWRATPGQEVRAAGTEPGSADCGMHAPHLTRPTPRTTAWGLPLHGTCPHAGARGTMRAGPGYALRLAPPNLHTAWRPPHPHIPCLVNSPEAWGSGVAMVHSLTSRLQSFGLPRTVPSHDEFRSRVQSMSLIPAQMSGGRTSGNDGCGSVHTRSPQASRARFPSRGALSCLEDESLRTLHRAHSEPACSSKGSVRLGLTGQGQKDLTYTCTRTHHTHMHTYITCAHASRSHTCTNHTCLNTHTWRPRKCGRVQAEAESLMGPTHLPLTETAEGDTGATRAEVPGGRERGNPEMWAGLIPSQPRRSLEGPHSVPCTASWSSVHGSRRPVLTQRRVRCPLGTRRSQKTDTIWCCR